MSDTYDAVVIGGGPAGATAAILLARSGWSVLLVERKKFPRRKVCGEYISATNVPLLRELGVSDEFQKLAGPPINRVGLFVGEMVLTAELPRVAGVGWGRALGREHLDGMLIQAAIREGADVRQPWSILHLRRDGDSFVGHAKSVSGGSLDFRARIVVAAHGSWEPGNLPGQEGKSPARDSDLFAFKSFYRDSALPVGWMPLIGFPGGYAGMAHIDSGRVGISVVVRRDRLAMLRSGGKRSAGEDVVAALMAHCRGVREALATAKPDGSWLAAGPLRVGIRLNQPKGVFPVGNAAGEAHSVIAEGLSMAMQSSWLLTQKLCEWKSAGGRTEMLNAVAREYAREWRRRFRPRLVISSVIARIVMHPSLVSNARPMLALFPGFLTWGARLSGKTTCVMPPTVSAEAA